jgi:hypothetical protein
MTHHCLKFRECLKRLIKHCTPRDPFKHPMACDLTNLIAKGDETTYACT